MVTVCSPDIQVPNTFRSVTVTGEGNAIGTDSLEPALSAPLRRDLGWAQVLRMSQSADHRDDPLLRQIRDTAAVLRGTRMIKVLSAEQVAGHLGGWHPYGFCYRACDIAHLHEPRDLTMLGTDGVEHSEMAFALRWRAVDPLDYEVPGSPGQPGLATLQAHNRVGAMILGTGFTPSNEDLVPEYITAGFADLPMPANAQIVAYVPGGEARWREVPCWVLQRDETWARLRLVRPDNDSLAATRARCYERGVYESWAPVGELLDHHIADIPYAL